MCCSRVRMKRSRKPGRFWLTGLDQQITSTAIIMSTKLYVGNLSFDATETDLRDLLGAHGPVNEIKVVMDRDTGRARGFAFATMNTEEGAKAAIAALNGKDWKGRAL